MPGENPFNKIELPVLISINLANHHNSFKQWKGSVLILAFLFLVSAHREEDNCESNSLLCSRLCQTFLVETWAPPRCHLCRSHCLYYEHTMEHLTLQLDVMSTLAKQCNNVLPGLVTQLWILAVFLSDFIVTCVTTRSSRYLLRRTLGE